jgi:hypothetical protein
VTATVSPRATVSVRLSMMMRLERRVPVCDVVSPLISRTGQWFRSWWCCS